MTFILDQPFWGRRIYELGIGPRHIPVQELTVPRLVEGIKYLQRPEVSSKAEWCWRVGWTPKGGGGVGRVGGEGTRQGWEGSFEGCWLEKGGVLSLMAMINTLGVFVFVFSLQASIS